MIETQTSREVRPSPFQTGTGTGAEVNGIGPQPSVAPPAGGQGGGGSPGGQGGRPEEVAQVMDHWADDDSAAAQGRQISPSARRGEGTAGPGDGEGGLRADPASPLEEAVTAAAAQGGLEVALAPSGGPQAGYIQGRAREFAVQHGAFGLKDGALVCGVPDAAQIISDASTVGALLEEILARAREAAPGVTVQARTLAVFCHGWEEGLGLGEGGGIQNAGRGGHGTDAFAESISASLSGDARVVLYACRAGSTVSPRDRRWRRGETPGADEVDDAADQRPPSEDEQQDARESFNHDRDSGGDGSIADRLRDGLTEGEGHEQREVWGHQLKGDGIGNPTWRAFSGPQAEGAPASTPLMETGPEGDLADEYELVHVEGELADWVRQRYDELAQERGGAPLPADRDFEGTDLSDWISREMPFMPSAMRPIARPLAEGEEARYTTDETREHVRVAVREDFIDWLALRLDAQRPWQALPE